MLNSELMRFSTFKQRQVPFKFFKFLFLYFLFIHLLFYLFLQFILNLLIQLRVCLFVFSLNISS
jgi:hypothetical protein